MPINNNTWKCPTKVGTWEGQIWDWIVIFWIASSIFDYIWNSTVKDSRIKRIEKCRTMKKQIGSFQKMYSFILHFLQQKCGVISYASEPSSFAFGHARKSEVTSRNRRRSSQILNSWCPDFCWNWICGDFSPRRRLAQLMLYLAGNSIKCKKWKVVAVWNMCENWEKTNKRTAWLIGVV